MHSAADAVKAVMAGAHGVQLVSEILKHGMHRFAEIRQDLTTWLTEHGYHSLAQVRGSMNVSHCPDPSVYERANYVRVLGSWRLPTAPPR